jgi:hypothetical protein
MARKPTDTVALTLRIREVLRRRLQREADKDDVSLNWEISRRLEASFEAERALDVGEKALTKVLDSLKSMEDRLGPPEKDLERVAEWLAEKFGLPSDVIMRALENMEQTHRGKSTAQFIEEAAKRGGQKTQPQVNKTEQSHD